MKFFKQNASYIFECIILLIFFVSGDITTDSGRYNSKIPNLICIISFVILSLLDLFWHYVKKERKGLFINLFINAFLANPFICYVVDPVIALLSSSDSYSPLSVFFDGVRDDNFSIYCTLMVILLVINVILCIICKKTTSIKNTGDGSKCWQNSGTGDGSPSHWTAESNELTR